MPINNKACTLKRRDITRADLPLSCPMTGEDLWNAHPKVYLPLVQNHAVCPYCETEYFLVEQTNANASKH